MEERELERLRAIQEEARRQRARERSEEAARQKALKWREEAEQRTREWRASKKESPGAAETAEKKLAGSEPRSATGSTQEATRRPWWRRMVRRVARRVVCSTQLERRKPLRIGVA